MVLYTYREHLFPAALSKSHVTNVKFIWELQICTVAESTHGNKVRVVPVNQKKKIVSFNDLAQTHIMPQLRCGELKDCTGRAARMVSLSV